MRKQANPIFIAVCLVIFVLALSQTVNAQQSPVVGTASTGVLQITIYSYNTNAQISYSPNTPSHSGYVWAWVDILIANTEADNINSNPQYAFLKDSQNNLYSGESIVNDPQTMKAMDLSCGNTIRGNLYFEIPATAKIVGFVWNDGNNNLAIPGSSSITSPTPAATSTTSTPTSASGSTASPTQTTNSASSPTPTTGSILSSSQNPTNSPTVPEFPQTTMLIAVVVMFLIVTSGLIAYRRHNS